MQTVCFMFYAIDARSGDEEEEFYQSFAYIFKSIVTVFHPSTSLYHKFEENFGEHKKHRMHVFTIIAIL